MLLVSLDSQVYAVNYKRQCIDNPYKDIVAKAPKSIDTTVTAAALSNGLEQTVLYFDGEYYFEMSTAENESSVVVWSPSPNNFFNQCPPLVTTFASLLNSIFSDGKSRNLSLAALAFIVIVCLAITAGISGIIFLVFMKRNTRRKQIISQEETGSHGEESSPHNARHLLNGHDENIEDSGKETLQLKVPLQTSC